MKKYLGILAVAAAALATGAAADPEPAQGKFRGMIVCEVWKDTPGTDILRAPIDLAIREGGIQFARPTFNPDGTRVTGNELGSGTLDASGNMHLTSDWNFRRFALHGEYDGKLSAGGGTLSGMQTSRGPNGVKVSRACHAAFVPTAIPE